MRLTDSNAASPIIHATSHQPDPLGLTPLLTENRQRFLRFSLSQQNDGLLPLHSISEVKQLTLADIVPVPDMPHAVPGICSWRGISLWLVDLAHLSGDPPLYERSQPLTSPTVIVVQHKARSLGLLVEKVGDVDLFNPDRLYQTSGLCPQALEPLVAGYKPKDEDGPAGVVLNVPAFLESARWQSLLSDTF